MGPNKVYRAVQGDPLLSFPLRAVRAFPKRVGLVVVARQEDRSQLDHLIAGFSDLSPRVVLGGRTRHRSEMAGLDAVGVKAGDLIGIHDGARPFLTAELWERCCAAAGSGGGAIPVLRSEAIFTKDSAQLRRLDGVMRAQTPQVFAGPHLLDAYRAAERQGGFAGVDTAETFARFTDYPIAAVRGDYRNLKVTTRADFQRAEALAKEWSPERWLSPGVG
jgi:2-C-methyl-D-erythritol 4-phosphate cytidylyltransferase